MAKDRSTGYWDDSDNVGVYAKKIAEDPAFGIGYTLGHLWKKNYNDRGINKELEDLRSQFGNSSTGAAGSAETGMAVQAGEENRGLSIPAQNARNALIADTNNATGYGGNGEWGRMKLLDETRSDNQLGQTAYSNGRQPQTLYQQMAHDVLAGNGGGSAYAYGLGRGNYSIADGIMPQQQAQQDVGSYGGDGLQQQQTSGAAALPANFDATATLAELRQKWHKNGRTAYQIEKLTELATPMLEKAQQQVNRREANRIMSAMSGLDPTNAEDRDILKQGVISLNRYDPAAAKVYANDIITGNQIWDRNNKLADSAANFERQRTLANENATRQLELMMRRQQIRNGTDGEKLQTQINVLGQNGYSDKDILPMVTNRRSGNGNGSGSSSTSSNSGYKVSSKTEDYLYDLAAQADMEKETWDPDEHDGQQWQPSKIQQYALTFRDNAAYKAAHDGRNQQTPLAQYPQNSVIKMMQDAYNSGRYTREQIEDVLVKERPDDYGNLIKWLFGDNGRFVHSNE